MNDAAKTRLIMLLRETNYVWGGNVSPQELSGLVEAGCFDNKPGEEEWDLRAHIFLTRVVDGTIAAEYSPLERYSRNIMLNMLRWPLLRLYFAYCKANDKKPLNLFGGEEALVSEISEALEHPTELNYAMLYDYVSTLGQVCSSVMSSLQKRSNGSVLKHFKNVLPRSIYVLKGALERLDREGMDQQLLDKIQKRLGSYNPLFEGF